VSTEGLHKARTSYSALSYSVRRSGQIRASPVPASGVCAFYRASILAFMSMIAAQGIYYIVTGLWPLASMRSFELVTGPKTDDWLVQTVGMLLAVIGISLLARVRRARPAADTRLLGGGTALAIGGMDVFVVLTGQAPPIYLADAVVEIVFLVATLWGYFTKDRAEPETAASEPRGTAEKKGVRLTLM
jgi:hypothetical protein